MVIASPHPHIDGMSDAPQMAEVAALAAIRHARISCARCSMGVRSLRPSLHSPPAYREFGRDSPPDGAARAGI
jgi:hypothetical protein